MTVFLPLGQHPDEPGPPIHGPATYPEDIAEQLATDAATIIARYPHPRSALLPLLHLVQSHDSYLTPAGIRFCAHHLGLTDAEVTAVATFYSMYRRTPTGDYLVGVCTNTLCAIMGGDAILDTLQDHLGITTGETTTDGTITLEHLECNAACDYAPVIMVNWDFYDNQTPTTARELVDALRTGQPPTPTRSQTLTTFTQTARTLAGLPNPTTPNPTPPDPTPPGNPTLAGLRYAHQHNMTAPGVEAPSDSVSGDTPERVVAAEAVKDEPAPAPDAHVPARPSTTETDPEATDSK